MEPNLTKDTTAVSAFTLPGTDQSVLALPHFQLGKSVAVRGGYVQIGSGLLSRGPWLSAVAPAIGHVACRRHVRRRL
jgi:hypothetical protein